MQLHNIAKSGIAAALVSLAVGIAPWRMSQAQEVAPAPLAPAPLGPAPTLAPPPAEAAEGAAVDAEGVETLTRGPVHEAFATPSATDPEPTATVANKPPEPIDEIAPDFKPEGAIWIPGYWEWDVATEEFIWISGLWRLPPPGMRWVPPYWTEADGGWQRVPGFWISADVTELEYREPPPASVDVGPSTPTPGENYFYVPGSWSHYDTGYRWRTGYWSPYRVISLQGWQVVHKPQATQQYVVQIAAAPAAEDDDRYAARLLGTIVGDDTGSRLFWELVDTGMAETAAWGAHEFQRAGVYLTYLACAPGETAANVSRLRQVLADVEAGSVTAEELEQAKNKICAHLVLQAERPTNRMFAVGNAWIQRRQYKTVREAVAAYRAVTLADVRAVIEKYPLTRTATVAVGPLTELASH